MREEAEDDAEFETDDEDDKDDEDDDKDDEDDDKDDEDDEDDEDDDDDEEEKDDDDDEDDDKDVVFPFIAAAVESVAVVGSVWCQVITGTGRQRTCHDPHCVKIADMVRLLGCPSWLNEWAMPKSFPTSFRRNLEHMPIAGVEAVACGYDAIRVEAYAAHPHLVAMYRKKLENCGVRTSNMAGLSALVADSAWALIRMFQDVAVFRRTNPDCLIHLDVFSDLKEVRELQDDVPSVSVPGRVTCDHVTTNMKVLGKVSDPDPRRVPQFVLPSYMVDAVQWLLTDPLCVAEADAKVPLVTSDWHLGDVSTWLSFVVMA